MNTKLLALVLGTSLFLSACVSGDDNTAIDNGNPQPDDTIGQADNADTNTTSGSDTGDAGVNTGDGCLTTAQLETDFIQQVNQARAQARMCGSQSFAATNPVTWDERLEAAALTHSQDMANVNFFSHTGSDGSNVGIRANNENYSWQRVSENIAAGHSSVSQVMNDWLASEGHCRNIMDPNITQLGASCWDNSSSQFGRYWTQVFATPQP